MTRTSSLGGHPQWEGDPSVDTPVAGLHDVAWSTVSVCSARPVAEDQGQPCWCTPYSPAILRRVRLAPVKRLALGGAVVAAVGAAIIWPRPGQAEISGLPLPAPAGTVWSVESGYNTGSHTGVDPHALDIVRSDGPTAGTPVLAPVAGTVSVASSGCVAIEASPRIAVLLCHLLPHRGVELGATVRRGQELGQVAPPGATKNHGLAHLHLAVHTTPGGGELRTTVPLTGRYALEGWDLPATKSANAYAGMDFRSTNHFAAFDPYYLYPGWNLVSWTGAASCGCDRRREGLGWCGLRAGGTSLPGPGAGVPWLRQ